MLVNISNKPKGAIFSNDKRHRFLLWRDFNKGINGTLLFIMLNPSTADALVNDMTVNRCCKYAKTWLYKRLVVVNLFSYISTDSSVLNSIPWNKLCPPKNLKYINYHIKRSNKIVCAWGNKGQNFYNSVYIQSIIKKKSVSLYCLKKNLDGSPHHPLRMKTVSNLSVYS